MTPEAYSFTASDDRLDEAFEVVASRLGISLDAQSPLPPAANDAFIDNIEARVTRRGLEAVPVTCDVSEATRLVAKLGTGVLALGRSPARFLVVLATDRRSVRVRTPSGTTKRLRTSVVARAVLDRALAGRADGVEALVEAMGLPTTRRSAVREAIGNRAAERLSIDGAWILRPPAGASQSVILRNLHLRRRLAIFMLASLLQYLVLTLSWRLIGHASLEASGLDDAYWPWLLAVATMNASGLLAVWMAGRLAIDVGGALKQRVITGALRLEPDEVRLHGAGHFMAVSNEAEAVEATLLAGGFSVLIGLVTLVVAFAVLGITMGAIPCTFLLIWVVVLGLLVVRYYRRGRQWAAHRRDRTNELVERMVGQRTLLAQIDLERWGSREDDDLEAYVRASREVDRAETHLNALAARAWPLLSGALLVFAFVHKVEGARLAAAIGATLLADEALLMLGAGLSGLSTTAISLELVWPLLRAARRGHLDTAPAASTPASPPTGDSTRSDDVVLEARDLTFQYRPDRAPVLRGCSLVVRAGDRILLEGSSGSGKSTLGAVLAALRSPTHGEIFLDGQPFSAVGPRAWRKRVVAVPQFHENHLFSSTYAFNVLMGLDWPPGPANTNRLAEVSVEVGLDSLLGRMPAGPQQQLGETGWKLSHGERSRVFIARALAQDARVIILDESLAAMDPLTMRQLLDALRKRDVALILIAHP